MPINLNRVFKNDVTGKVSNHILDLVGDLVHIDKEFIASLDQIRDHRTMFKDISIFPVCLDSTNITYTGEPLAYREFIKYLVDNIRQVIKNTWDDNKFHIIMHSSGYDSRVLSYLIKKLYGRGIVEGKILFICLQPEGNGFKRIMNYLGWPDDKYIVYNENAKPDEYYGECFDFNTAWESYNGLSQWPSIMFRVIKNLQQEGVVPNNDKNIQVYGMGYTDQLFRHKIQYRKTASQNKFVTDHYYNPLPQSLSNFNGDHILPMLDPEIIGLIIKYNWYYKDCLDIKQDILKRLDPGMTEIPNSAINSPYNPYHKLSNNIFNNIKDEYSNSFYGQMINPGMVNMANPILEYSPFWACYQASSVVEHLLDTGISISY